MNNGHCSLFISIWGQNLGRFPVFQVVKSLCGDWDFGGVRWVFGGVRCMRSEIRAHSWSISATHGLRRSSGYMGTTNTFLFLKLYGLILV